MSEDLDASIMSADLRYEPGSARGSDIRGRRSERTLERGRRLASMDSDLLSAHGHESPSWDDPSAERELRRKFGSGDSDASVHRRERERLEEELRHLSKRLEEAQHDLANEVSRRTAVMSDEEAARKRIDKLDRDLRDAEEDLTASRRESSLREMRSRQDLETAEGSLREAQDSLATLRAKSDSEIQRLTKALNAAEAKLAADRDSHQKEIAQRTRESTQQREHAEQRAHALLASHDETTAGLKRELDEANAATQAATNALADQQRKNEDLRAQVQGLLQSERAQEDHMNKLQAELEAAHEREEEARVKIDSLTRDKEAAANAKRSTDASVEQLRAAGAAYVAEREGLQRQLSATKERETELRELVQTLNDREEARVARDAAAVGAKPTTPVIASPAKAAPEDVRKQMETHRQHAQQLERQVQDLQASLARAHVQHEGEKQFLTNELDRVRSQLPAGYSAGVSSEERLIRRNEELQLRFADAAEKLQRVLDDKAVAMPPMSAAFADREKELASREKGLRDAMRSLEERQKDIELREKTAAAQSEKGHLNKELEQRTMESLATDVESLKQQLYQKGRDKIAADGQIRRLSQLLEMAEGSLHNYEGIITALRESYAVVESLRERLTEAERTIAVANAERQAVDQRLKTHEAEMEDKRQRLQHMEGMVHELRALKAADEATIAAMRGIDDEKSALQRRLNEVETVRASTTDTLELERGRIADLQGKLQGMVDLMAEKAEAHHAVCSQLHRLTVLVDESDSLAALNTHVKLEAEIDSLTSRLNRAFTDRVVDHTEKKQLMDEIRRLENLAQKAQFCVKLHKKELDKEKERRMYMERLFPYKTPGSKRSKSDTNICAKEPPRPYFDADPIAPLLELPKRPRALMDADHDHRARARPGPLPSLPMGVENAHPNAAGPRWTGVRDKSFIVTVQETVTPRG